MAYEIKCPKCGEVFTVDEAGYAAIVKQVRDKEFNKELKDRLEEREKQQESAVELAKSEVSKGFEKQLNAKDLELQELRNQVNSAKLESAQEYQQQISKRDNAIQDLRNQLQMAKSQILTVRKEHEAAVKEAVSEQKKEILSLKNKIDTMTKDNQLAVTKAVAEKEQKIVALEAEVTGVKKEQNLIVEKAVAESQKKIIQLEGQIVTDKEIAKNNEQNLKKSYETQLKDKEEEIQRIRDMKLQMSTKMVGETLEQHCEIEFNNLRATGFQGAYFEKDNDDSKGSKGDYIFRDYDEDGNEYISIMFEMKNEMDTTATKHNNKDFFDKLDKDRNTKKCEYAVLVSLLEQNSDYYNSGIVDVSYKYDKMYVIRPQFFIPMITMLRNAARKSLDYRKQLVSLQQQNIDVTNFEKQMNIFKEGFANNYRIAGDHFKKAIDQIDKSIDALQKTRDALVGSERQLRLANDKAQDLSIKKLTKNSPILRAQFEEVKKEK